MPAMMRTITTTTTTMTNKKKNYYKLKYTELIIYIQKTHLQLKSNSCEYRGEGGGSNLYLPFNLVCPVPPCAVTGLDTHTHYNVHACFEGKSSSSLLLLLSCA